MSVLQIFEVLGGLLVPLGVVATLVMLTILVHDDYKSIKRENEENKSNEED